MEQSHDVSMRSSEVEVMPHLEHIVLQRFLLNRRTEDDGVLTPLSGKFTLSIEARGSLTVKTSPRNNKPYIVALMYVDAEVYSKEDEVIPDVECEVALQGFFSTTPQQSTEDLKLLVSANKDLYHELGKTMYPVAVREIRLKLVDAGLPPPSMISSFRKEEMETLSDSE